ncbi:PucR family transcriptional regulator [Rhodococcus koreensis]
MAVHQGHWVRQLRVEPGTQIAPVCSPAVLGPAIEQVGQDAIDWAIALGHTIAVRAAEVSPRFGKGPAQIATLRLGTESAAIIAMLGIDSGSIDTPAITEDTIRAIQDYVHRGIPLPTIWASVRQGHAWLAEAYMRACVEHVPVAEQPTQLQLAVEVLFNFVDRFSEAIGREYGLEHERWVMTTVAARDEMVRTILAGDCGDVPAAENILHYSLAHRTHIGVVLWADSSKAAEDSALHKIAVALLHAAGAEQTLLIPYGRSSMYAWGNSARPLSVAGDELASVLDKYNGVRAAIGDTHTGLSGFVATHQEALEVREMIETLGMRDKLIDFTSVHLLTLLAHNPARARRFVRMELGALAADEPQVAELRKTVAAYLRLKRSPLAVANELFVVRNTVSYRIKKAEELLGRSLDERTLETWVALTLKEVLPPDVIEAVDIHSAEKL